VVRVNTVIQTFGFHERHNCCLLLLLLLHYFTGCIYFLLTFAGSLKRVNESVNYKFLFLY
jgi:hypothetical protein